MLFEAFFWDPAAPRPAFEAFRREPEFAKQLAGWGRAGDRALVAERDPRSTPPLPRSEPTASGEPHQTGAAWYRLWTPELHSYGFVDARTPELGIAVAAPHRAQGIGRRLLVALAQRARADGHPALSLSVSPDNAARRLYESLGFRKVGESGTSWTLWLPLGDG
ncbi:MAG: N-acetyltransferase [Proteobacteria bacterium]|nr:MAG: N-acetyltransferase [Pseudomonadota bacterium]